MIRAALVLTLALALGACFRQHDAGAIADTDCVSCHAPEFQMATTHMGQGSTRCAACHAATVEPPWAFAHPEQPFSITRGKHARFATDCHKCHDASRGNDYRANLDCYGGGACHGDSHNRNAAAPGRCFACHPSGDAED